jgi:lysophospholipase L1-like esterase
LQDPSAAKLEWRLGERIRTAVKTVVPEFIQYHIRELEVRLHQDKVRKKAAAYPLMDRVPEENVNVFHSDLVRLVDALRQSGVEPVLATHATFFGKPLSREDQQMLTLWREWIPMLTGEGLLDLERRMNAEIRAVAAERHIVLIDTAAEIPPGPRYFGDFTHFTTLGAELMARKVAEGLEPVLSSEVASSTKQNDPSRKVHNGNPLSQFH